MIDLLSCLQEYLVPPRIYLHICTQSQPATLQTLVYDSVALSLDSVAMLMHSTHPSTKPA